MPIEEIIVYMVQDQAHYYLLVVQWWSVQEQPSGLLWCGDQDTEFSHKKWECGSNLIKIKLVIKLENGLLVESFAILKNLLILNYLLFSLLDSKQRIYKDLVSIQIIYMSSLSKLIRFGKCLRSTGPLMVNQYWFKVNTFILSNSKYHTIYHLQYFIRMVMLDLITELGHSLFLTFKVIGQIQIQLLVV